ncbi:hypothetical protein [Lacihabitans soyangensis]|uniref:Uncharacterized protein n=1 Tax=Lacihabitans soyangensis TaxID=869394 RepID=A0AAE3H2V1_9BACT|nr:hypothetical protein [Lacihabitans soyangensis]MCP9762974.1 hypothetical protein [Lacihabitans soyangensis]
MNLKTINIKPIHSLIDFCKIWAPLYPDGKRDKEFYFPALEAKTINEELLLGFFEWKNGTKLSTLKKASLKNKILKLEVINDLRDRETVDLKKIRASFPDVSDIWLITLAHLINPDAFPIFDQHVYRAYKFLELNTVDIYDYDKEYNRLKLYRSNYLPFFLEIVHDDIIGRKTLDEAFWTFGKFLATYHRILE